MLCDVFRKGVWVDGSLSLPMLDALTMGMDSFQAEKVRSAVTCFGTYVDITRGLQGRSAAASVRT